MAVLAVAGGTGGLGSNVVKACAANPKHKVIVVSRISSKTPEWLEKLSNVQVRKADYASEESLAAALKDADTVLCTFTVADGTWADTQIRVLNAALSTGTVQRFTPCNWGNGWSNYHRVDLMGAQPPVWHALRAVVDKQKQEAGKQFEWAAFHPGGFMNYLGIGADNAAAATAGLAGGADMVWNVAEMRATLPMTKDGKAPRITMTELSDIGKAVSIACELPFGAWEEHMGIAGDVVTLDKVIDVVEKARGRQMTVEQVPFEQVQKRASEATEMFEKMWWQIYEGMAAEQEGECVFDANVNSIIEGRIQLQTVEEFVNKYWAGK